MDGGSEMQRVDTLTDADEMMKMGSIHEKDRMGSVRENKKGGSKNDDFFD